MISIVRIQELIKSIGCLKCERPIDHVCFSRNDYSPCDPIIISHLAPRGYNWKPVYGTYRICVPDRERHQECTLIRTDFSKKKRKELNFIEIQAFMKDHTCPKCGESIGAIEINIGDKSRIEQVKLIHVYERYPNGHIRSYCDCSLSNGEFYDMML
jgi:hypothetical protein